MRRLVRPYAILILSTVSAVLCSSFGARADVLSAEEVLASSRVHAPQIQQRLARVDAARGAAVTAEGAFDTRVESDAYSRLSGFWDGQVVDTTVSQNFRPFGLTLFGGYRISDNRFPIYEDEFFTNRGGEIKAGFVLSLLRDRAFDQERAGLVDAAIGLTAAETRLLLARLEVQHGALIGYFRWVAAGLQLEIYRNLLKIAEERDTALRRRVREGDVAEVLITENLQNVLRRETLVVEAERQLATMAQALSIFYRDSAGTSVVPNASDLPSILPAISEPSTADEDVVARDLIDRVARPELELIDANLALAENKFRLARNDLKPQLDLQYEVARDLGSVGPGGPSREETDNIVSFRFSLPLQRRDARGRMASARAEVKALEFERQLLEDQIAVEIRTLRVDLDAARELVGIAFREQEQAEAMQAFEKTRFENGISDFFVLNLREESAADARIRRVAAQLRYFMSRADYDAATVNLEALGLSS